MTAPPRVLMVEDDVALRESVVVALEGEGYTVMGQRDGHGIGDLMSTFRPDLAVLDIRLPEGPDGLSVARRIRAESDIPIVFVTARDEVTDRLAGFDAGADDYVVKPFSMAELLARIRALLRRTGRLVSAVYEVGDVIIDRGAREVVRGGEAVDLTPTELDILVALADQRGAAVSKDRLLALVWGFEHDDPNLVEVHVSSLRRKLEEHGPRVIHTVRGVGYVLRA